MLRTIIDRLPIGWAGRLALQRLLSQWRSLLTIIAGTLLGASVGALVPLYTTAVAQVSMVERLNQQPARDINFSADISLIPSQTQDFDASVALNDAQFRSIVDQKLAAFPGWLNRTVSYLETTALSIDPPAEVTEPGVEPTIPNPTTRAYVSYYDGWTEAVTLVAGRLPQDQPESTDADIEVVIPLAAQSELNLNIGDILLLDQGGPRGGWDTSKNVRAIIVGVAGLPEPLTPLERAYFMEPSPLRLGGKSGDFQAEYPVLTTQAAFKRVITDFIPDTSVRVGWRLILDHTRLPFPSSPAARQTLFDMQTALNDAFDTPAQRNLNYNQYTKLIDWQVQSGTNIDKGILLAYEVSVRSLDAPFGLLLLQVGALVIFFLIVTAALVRRGERREIAMLQSRGARDSSIVLIRSIEALAICMFAALVAPILSQNLLILITPFFARYENLPLILSSTDFAYAAVAAAVAFTALMFTLRPVLRLPLISAGGSTLRSDQQPWWQRYYLDVLLVVLGIAALWRLVGRDNPLFTTTAGGRSTDPFLLLAPALLFLGLGSVLLRVFPLIASFASRVLAAGRGVVAPLATWQLSREPVHYGRITFLLALAVGIGWFATSFRATVNRSQNDQAIYKVGTDIRFDERDVRLNAARARPETAYTSVPGVQNVSIAWREPGVNLQPDNLRESIYGDLLAVDASSFANVVQLRSDLGAVQLPRPADQPISLPQYGVELPFIPQKLNLWANFTVLAGFGQHLPDLDRLRNRTKIYARLQDAAGAWLRIPFRVVEVEYLPNGAQAPGVGGGGDFLTSGWAYYEADLSAASPTYQPVAPLRLVSLYWDHRGRAQQGEIDLRLTLAGLTGTSADNLDEKVSLNLFNRQDWSFAYDSGAPSTGQYTTGYIDEKRGNGISAQWSQQAAVARLGLLLNYPEIAEVPAIISESAAARLSLAAGQVINLPSIQGVPVAFRLVGNQKYYPSLYDSYLQDGKWRSDIQYRPFLIADRDSLFYVLNRRPSAALYPDEVWLKTAPDSDANQVLTAIMPADRSAAATTAQTLPGELANLQTDPLSLGLLGLMILAFIIAMALSIVGLLTYATLTANARRSEFGVLRALGLSSLRLIGQLAVEQAFVIVLGVLLGGALGGILSSQVVPRLALDTSSRNITPPFIVQVEAGALAQYGLLIAGVLILVLLFSLLLVRGLSISRTLRLGEE
ncbi:MAG: FtsX-like permease family protein [Anaerolineae bacterium]|nr:FtsX-like permease family protein [Anaerolineae bacterium]